MAINEVPEILDAIESRTELPEDIQDEENDFLVTTPREEALRHERSEQSMSALLDGLQDTSSLLGEISRKVCFFISIYYFYYFFFSVQHTKLHNCLI